MAVRTPALVVLSLTLIAVSSARGAAYVISTMDDTAVSRVPARPLPSSTPEAEPVVTDPVAALVVAAEAGVAPEPKAIDRPADYAAMANIYAKLPSNRAATLIAGLPRRDGAGLLSAMPEDAAGAIIGELDDETAIALTLTLTRGEGE